MSGTDRSTSKSQFDAAIDVSDFEAVRTRLCDECDTRAKHVHRDGEWRCTRDHTTPDDGQQTLIPDGGAVEDETDRSDIYRDDRNYDKCKWERAWGELNAALHARTDALDLSDLLGGDHTDKQEQLADVIEVFDEIAEKHNVESFEECWNGDVEECDQHEPTDRERPCPDCDGRQIVLKTERGEPMWVCTDTHCDRRDCYVVADGGQATEQTTREVPTEAREFGASSLLDLADVAVGDEVWVPVSLISGDTFRAVRIEVKERASVNNFEELRNPLEKWPQGDRVPISHEVAEGNDCCRDTGSERAENTNDSDGDA